MALRLFAVLCNLAWLWLGNGLSLVAQMAIPLVTVAAWALSLHPGLYESPRVRAGQIRRSWWLLLGYYLCILAVLLFFGGLFHLDRGYGGTVNLVPFHTVDNYIQYYKQTGSIISVKNIVGNVVILLPLGVILPVMFSRMERPWIFLPTAALVAVGVELVQFFTATGTADIDDSILNFIGAVLGYTLTALWLTVVKRR